MGAYYEKSKKNATREKKVQTETVPQLSVKIEELNIESIRDRLRREDMHVSDTKEMVVARLARMQAWREP